MSRLADTLRQGRVLLMDGAAGTEFLRGGLALAHRFEHLNQTDPERVLALHRAYAEAGAEVLLTNTFQAWRLPTNPNIGDIFAHAIDLARTAAPDAMVLADVGPVSDSTVPSGVPDLLRGCRAADGILLETWSDCDHLSCFAQTRNLVASDVPLLVSFSFRRNAAGMLTTFKDTTPEECAHSAVESGCLALGVNCGQDIGLAELLDIVSRYRSVTGLPLFVRPNAGAPDDEGGLKTPETMAGWLPRLFAAGVRMIGGCCGTTPAHIAAFQKAVDEWNTKTP